MGRASRPKRQRKEPSGRGPEAGEGEIYTRPTLQAFVICERVDTHQDGVHSLYRIVDKFQVRLEIHGPQGVPVPQVQVNVPVNFVLFARFGAGVGRFRASFEVLDPDEQPIGSSGDHWFWLRARENAQNIINNISMPIKKSGPHKARAYLDGEIVGEYVFMVDFQQEFVPTGRPAP